MPVLPPMTFPTYLLPPRPFRRRASTASTSSSAASTSSGSTAPQTNVTVPPSPSASSTAPRPPPAPQHPPPPHHGALVRCARCLTHLCTTAHLISKGFTGRHGRAYLVAPSPVS